MVVCGIDGSRGSRRALQEAIRITVRRGGLLKVVTAFTMWSPWASAALASVPVADAEAVRVVKARAARALVDEVSAVMGADLVLPEISVEAVPGEPAGVLVRLARGADELVVGRRGRGAVGSVVLGAVGLGCVLHAPCPVTVVPDSVAA